MDAHLLVRRERDMLPDFQDPALDVQERDAARYPATPASLRTTDACVFLLLSTFNGAAFLRQQLESLVTQTYENWVLYWRDDGSSDETLDILAGFAATVGAERCVKIGLPCERVYPAASYMAMIRAVLPVMGPTDTVAFVDQDDLWLPTKLRRGILALTGKDPAIPTLYCARLRVVDARLHCLTETRISPDTCGFPASLTQNIATGCTIMLNRRAVELVAGSILPNSSMHDWWCYLVVTAAGGPVLIDDAVVALYRQHGHNVVGAQRSWLGRAVAALRRGPSMFMNVLRQHVDALLAHPELMSESAHDTAVQLERALKGGVRQRIAVLRTRGLRRQTWSENVIFCVWFLIG
jgi:Glycosyl transferase family 2